MQLNSLYCDTDRKNPTCVEVRQFLKDENLKNDEIEQSLQTKIAVIYQDGNDERINAVRDAVFAYVCSREPSGENASEV